MTLVRGPILAAAAVLLTMPTARPADLEQVSPDEMISLARAAASQMMMCWSPVSEMKKDDVVVLDIHLNRDGTLTQPPQLYLAGADATLPSADATAAAMRAVASCAPYTLPGDLYERWKYQRVRFDPSSMLRYESGLSSGTDASPSK